MEEGKSSERRWCGAEEKEMSYSVDILKKSAFQDELMNVLDSENAKLKMGNLAHGIVLSYFKNRIKELDKSTKA
jgi:hypothetical protein